MCLSLGAHTLTHSLQRASFKTTGTEQRVHLKQLPISYNTLHNAASSYLSTLLQWLTPLRTLGSSSAALVKARVQGPNAAKDLLLPVEKTTDLCGLRSVRECSDWVFIPSVCCTVKALLYSARDKMCTTNLPIAHT